VLPVEGELQQLVGANLRALRERRGLSQEALADELGIHRTYESAIERGKRNLSLRAVERLAEALGVDPMDLLARPAKSRRGRTSR
jgi:transcriptional regulator with XRE-family HTH domain